MRFTLFTLCLAAIGCAPTHTDLLDDMESVAIGMLDVSQDMDCNDPDEVPEGDYECSYEGELSVRVYDARVGEESSSDVVDLGFMSTELDLVMVDGFADFVVHEEVGHVSMAGSLTINDSRDYEELFIEVSQVESDKIQVRGTADGIDFRFDLIQFSDARKTAEPSQDCGFEDEGPACE